MRVTPEQIPARDYFFVVDVSGSMAGFPLDTARDLMARLLNNLKPSDRFNILFFSGGSAVLSPQPLAATPHNINRAINMMNKQRGGGGTELYAALQRAFAMPGDDSVSRNIVLVTDGYISAEDRVFRLVDEQLHRNNLFAFGIGSSVNRFLIESIARVGRAEGETNAEDAERTRLGRQLWTRIRDDLLYLGREEVFHECQVIGTGDIERPANQPSTENLRLQAVSVSGVLQVGQRRSGVEVQ